MVTPVPGQQKHSPTGRRSGTRSRMMKWNVWLFLVALPLVLAFYLSHQVAQQNLSSRSFFDRELAGVALTDPSYGMEFFQPPRKICGQSFTEFKGWLSERKKNDLSNPTNTFLWTVSGGKDYLRRLPMLLKKWSELGLSPLTVVSLDVDTAKMACKLGYFAVEWDVPKHTYSRVADAKFGFTAALARNNVRQWFMELDLFCKQSPIPLVRSMITQKEKVYDIIHLGHGDMNFYPNIGMYYVQPKPSVAQHFERLLDVLEYSKDHPQYMGSGGNLKPFFDQDTYFHCLPPFDEYGFDWGGRFQRNYYIIESNKTVDLLDKCRKNQINITYKAISHTDINSHHPPTILDNTICIHPLSTAAFSSLDIKIATAQYMGFDPEYDIARASRSKRFLKDYAGDLTINECWGASFLTNHVKENNNGEKESFQYHVAALIAMAKKSNRILVLPRHFRDKNAWAASLPAMVDIRSIQKLVPITFVNGEQARQIPKASIENVMVPSDYDKTNFDKTLNRLFALADTPVVALQQSCGLARYQQKQEADPFILDIIQKLYWCLDEANFQPKFHRGIGSFQKFCMKG